MNLQSFLLSLTESKNYYHTYGEIETSIDLNSALSAVMGGNCTCKHCSLYPNSLCLAKLFAWQALTKELVKNSLLWKEGQDSKVERKVLK
jgi:hypothetical protein